MRKYIIVAFALLLILLTPFTSIAHASEEGKMSFQDMYNDWEMNGYPDYVGHVIYDDTVDKYEIGLVNATEADKNEILSKIGNNDGVVLGTARYSYNELLKFQNQIIDDTNGVEGIYGLAVGWTSVDGEVIGFGESGKEFRIILTVDENLYGEYVKKLQEDYGDMVHVETGEMAVELGDDSGLTQSNTALYLTIFAVFSLAILGVFFINRGAVLVKQSASGDNITESRPLGREEVISAVKESGIKPKDSVYRSILDKIKE